MQSKPTPDLVRRHVATEATLKRYRRKDFDWKGPANCGGMFRFHAKKMGHRLPKWPPYRSALGMLRALKSLGHGDLTALLDSLPSLARIAPAQMMMGDVAVVVGGAWAEGDDAPLAGRMAELGAIVLCLGPQKIIGWHFEHGTRMVVMDVGLDQIRAAWRL